MPHKPRLPNGYSPAQEPTLAAAPAAAPSRRATAPIGSLPMPRRAKPSVPMTGEATRLSAPRLPDLVRYEMVEGGIRRRWVPGFTRRGPGVPDGWMEEGSPEENAAKKEAGL